MKMNKLKLLAILTVASVVSFTSCKTDDYEAKVGLCPLVVSTIPTNNAIDVPLNQVISATFNEKMEPSTINQASFIIQQGTTTIAGTVTYNGLTASFTPASPLLPNVLYSGTITRLAKDLFGQALQQDYKWSFTSIAQVNLESSPTAGGTTTMTGTFAKGSSVTVTATSNMGYSFVNWTLNGTPVSINPSYQFTMDGNKTLVANFSLQFVVGLSSNPVEGGITTGAGTYTAGANVTVTATPNSEYTFINWTEGLTVASTDASYAFQLSESRNLVANFAANTYTLNVNVENGTVTKIPGKTSYNSGEIVVLTATPAAGYTFTGWSGDATGSQSSVSVTMNANKNVTANFAVIATTYTLNVTAINGTVLKAPSKTNYNSGEIVVLTATPATGYTFTGWSGDATGSQNSVSVTMDANKNVIANFAAIISNTYSLNVNAINGNVVKNPDETAYNSGDIVQLTATANSGYIFNNWSGDANGSSNPLSVTMNSDKNITANFIAQNPVSPAAINLGSSGNFSILTKSGISSTGITSVQGDIGVSPAAAAAITGFGLIMDTNGQSSHTSIATHVTGKVYASDYAPPTPSNLTVAVLDMENAYTTANNLVTPAPVLEQGAGNLSGLTLAPGLYKWSTGVLINPDASVTLSGGANDTWVFQIAQDLTLLSSAKINLIGGAQAKNIIWVVAGQAVLGTNTVLYGTILSKTLISLNTGSKVTGKLLAQTAVTLNACTVVEP